MSVSSITIESAVCAAFSGTGLHPPAVPTDCGLIGAAQFLQTTPLRPFVEPTGAANFASVEYRRDRFRPAFGTAKTSPQCHFPLPGTGEVTVRYLGFAGILT